MKLEAYLDKENISWILAGEFGIIALLFAFETSNWNMAAAIAAIFSAGAIVWQTKRTLKIQTLNQMLTAWQSPPLFPRIRKQAAVILWRLAQEQTAILVHNPASAVAVGNQTSFDLEFIDGEPSNVNAILDFFETIAFFVKKGDLDFEYVYHSFFWVMACYWFWTQKYINDARADEGESLWKEYSELMPSLLEREGKELTVADAKEFLMDEQLLTL